jgi:type IV fimbrial biogenesis protein FimT
MLGREERADMLMPRKSPHPTPRRKRGGRGFTLIELVVAITLLGILIGLGFPSLSLWIHNTQVRSVAEALQNGLRTAQAEAVRRNRLVVMTFTNDGSPTLNPTAVAGGVNWSIQTVASPWINNNVAEFLGAGSFASVASGVTITGAASYPAICFNANGRLVAQPSASTAPANCAIGSPLTSFSVAMVPSASNRPLNVTVAVGGQVRICDPNLPALSSTSAQGC